MGKCVKPGYNYSCFSAGIDCRLFDKQIQYFESRYNVIVWDAPAHGSSWPFRFDFDLFDKAKWLNDILNQEGITKPVIVGQSMGGYVGQAYAQLYPDKMTGFVPIDSAPLQRSYVTAVEIWLLKRMEPVYAHYPWKWLLKSGSEGVATSDYGRNLMREMMLTYDGNQKRYAQIAGLPAVYGLYGSVFPIILFAVFSTSPQFIFGVDAAPAALIGSALLGMGIEGGSKEALEVVPVLTFFVAVWLLAFYLMHAGKLVNYISAPVMGGFISGICMTIILMQVPKLLGGTAGTGELPELLEHILETAGRINFPSLMLGLISLAILLAVKKVAPKFPMAVVLMAAGAVLTVVLPMEEWGIRTLEAVKPGLPQWKIPDLALLPLNQVITVSLSVAVVIMAETLLAENNFAQKNGYRINDDQELLAFAAGNLVAALTGCCPINGSVSRTAMGEQYQGKTQLMSIVAGASMLILLVCGTGFIGYLPVPVLTAIVISALLGATEFKLAAKLWKVSRTECLIFWSAFVGVLLLGTINGVLIGIILSFSEMVIRSSKPARCFVGIQPGHRHFRDLAEGSQIHAVEGVLVYRFSSNLFFANVNILQQDIEAELEKKKGTKAVILDASGIGSIDITAADRLAILYEVLKEQGIRFYITEHIADLNEQMRKLGLGYLISEGCVRRTIHIALKDMGINRPYPLEGGVDNEERSASRKRYRNSSGPLGLSRKQRLKSRSCVRSNS